MSDKIKIDSDDIKIRIPTAKGTIKFKNKKRAAKKDKVKRKAKHKKLESDKIS